MLGDEQYDLILDNVGDHSLAAYRRCLRADGICVLVRATAELSNELSRYTPTSGAPTFVSMLTRVTRDDLLPLAAMLSSGQVVPHVDAIYPLDRTAEALQYIGTQRVRGKLIISVTGGTSSEG